MSTVGERLREQRKINKLTQEAFGRLGGVSTKTQGAYERNERFADTVYLQRIKHRTDVLYIITGRREGQPESLIEVYQSALLEAEALMEMATSKIKAVRKAYK